MCRKYERYSDYRMLTIFAIPKPFEGHIGMIQRNAIRSWQRLVPACQIVLCGDEVGSRETAAHLGTDHIPEIGQNEFGTPLLNSVFQLVEDRTSSRLLCYVNADLILLPDFLDAVAQISKVKRRFLMVGETWNLKIVEEPATEHESSEIELRRAVAQTGTVRPPLAIDYFVYSRDTLGPLPPFAVGRPAWDNWMIYRARSLRIPVVDASASTLVIHQAHNYEHVRHSREETWEGPEADRNRALLPIPTRLFSLADATHLLTPVGLLRAPRHRLSERIHTTLLLSSAFLSTYRVLGPVYRALKSLRRRLAWS